MDLDLIVAEVAAAVGLAEGEAGVRDVLRIVARAEPVATSQVSRMTELPVPIVTAVLGELRKRSVVDRTRPASLTAEARAVVGSVGPPADAECDVCGGLGLRIPADFAALADELEQAAIGAPQARVDLDQSHCTVLTKIRRVLFMHQAGALGAGARIVLLGDDDLVSVTIARAAALTGVPARLTVIDADPAVLDWIAASGVRAELVEHDLRRPLPASLAGQFDVVCTDPPYTVPGAELFLSRAVGALVGGPGRHVFFSFGARRPAEMLATQRLIADLGLAIRSVTPNFNSYLGAGILGGTSHLYHLRSTSETAPLIDGVYAGPLYTADVREQHSRPYRCAGCGAVYTVGPGSAWAVIGDLRAAGCPDCGGTTFRPLPRSHPR
jgi:predicted methyltransferase